MSRQAAHRLAHARLRVLQLVRKMVAARLTAQIAKLDAAHDDDVPLWFEKLFARLLQSRRVQAMLVAVAVIVAVATSAVKQTPWIMYIVNVSAVILLLAHLAFGARRVAHIGCLSYFLIPTVALIGSLVRSPAALNKNTEDVTQSVTSVSTILALAGAWLGAQPSKHVPMRFKLGLLAVNQVLCVFRAVVVFIRTGKTRAGWLQLSVAQIPMLTGFFVYLTVIRTSHMQGLLQQARALYGDVEHARHGEQGSLKVAEDK